MNNEASTRWPLAPQHAVTDPSSKDILGHPGSIKASKQLLFLLGEIFNTSPKLLPHKPTVLQHRLPNVEEDSFIGPKSAGKDFVISLSPNRPHASTLEQGPKVTELLESRRKIINKNDLIPVKSRPRARVRAPRSQLV
jgi:hypothetical protein